MTRRLPDRGSADVAEPTEREPLLGSSDGDNDSISTASTAINRNGTVKSTGEEEASLSSQTNGEAGKEFGRSHVARIISVLLIGIFVAHTDGSILLATHPIIASEFNQLTYSSWLITSFALASAATQTLYGKLSDIYGRKPLVLTAYVIFAVGCAIVGMGQTMWQVVLGRIISGAGASGMAALVSVLITDLLPIRDVAQWRAYVNLVATFGRSVGGPLGGWLADMIGWRWSFLGQVPIITVAIVLCAAYLPGGTNDPEDLSDSAILVTKKSKFSRIDFKGSFIFALTVLALLLPTEIGGVRLPWSHPIIVGLFALSLVLLFLFIEVEKRQEEPILPLEIFHKRDAVLSFLIAGLQTAAQLALMFSVPLYFQVTARASNTVAGAHLVPAVVGNAVGGILSGFFIKRSGRYKSLIIAAVTSSSIGYLLLMLRWHGNTNWLESLYIAPGGFGSGIAQSALFISLQVVVDPAHIAPAISFMYLSTGVWYTMGLAVSNAIMQTNLRWGLARRLLELGLSTEEIQKVISSAISDLEFVGRSTGAIREAIVEAYVDGFWWTHSFSFLCSTTAFVLALLLKQRRLDSH
ncbi:major facilitator superfamily domain-containing protein [Bombardia bombarda]|uniref:Major facilitator superfamily domain-containing protein n=1 Tax=Bombardia bombarda TaxID=252184 RepID=A0AA39WAN0_9PEZI|nr:major facilitator superfamily domain-containing protein [Bombardia bombarda]